MPSLSRSHCVVWLRGIDICPIYGYDYGTIRTTHHANGSGEVSQSEPRTIVRLTRKDAAILAWLAGEGMRTIAGIRLNVVEETEVVALAGTTAARQSAAKLIRDIPEVLDAKDEEDGVRFLIAAYERLIGPVAKWLESLVEPSTEPSTQKE